MSAMSGLQRRSRALVLLVPVVVALVGFVTLGGAGGGAGADTSLVGYNASSLAIGSQYAFNVPGLVPLPNENLIEEDVPFARISVGDGPVVNSIAAPYYPGDIAANLGSLLLEFGAPNLPVNDPLLAESDYPSSANYSGSASFGVPPSQSSPANPSIYSSSSDATSSGGDATGTVSDLSLDNMASLSSVTSAASSALGSVTGNSGGGSSTSQSLLDIGNISSSDNVTLGSTAITSTATSEVKSIDIAGLVDISDLTSTASATSDGTTGTPTSTVHLAQVTVDGESAYIDSTGVHIPSTDTPSASITPAQLQETVNATLSQDGISIQLLNPTNTSQGTQASANTGGLQISISHQFDVPFIPGEPTIPVPQLGNVGLPAGVYTATTSITFGLAEASVDASGVASGNSGNSGSASTTATTSAGGGSPVGTIGNTGNTGSFGTGSFDTGSVESLGVTGNSGSAGGGPTGSTPLPLTSTSFPIRGIPAPIGWTVTALLACILAAYPLLLLARWQFSGRRRT